LHFALTIRRDAESTEPETGPMLTVSQAVCAVGNRFGFCSNLADLAYSPAPPLTIFSDRTIRLKVRL
jgi:hypothetical protein